MLNRFSAPRASILCAFFWGLPLPATTAAIPVANPSFEQGTDLPTGWTLLGTGGDWLRPGAAGQRGVLLRGDGRTTSAWLSEPVPLEPNTIYRLRFQARRLQGTSGLPTTGPVFCNRDLTTLGTSWQAFESHFQTPRQLTRDTSRLRLGQWEMAGAVSYDDVHLERALPVYQSGDDLLLGEGEVLHQQQYTFTAPLNDRAANCARPLAWHQCDYNTDRWRFSSPQDQVVYRHQVGHRAQQTAGVQAQISWYARGQLVVAASRDGQTWQPLGTLGRLGTVRAEIPAAWLPAETIWVRLSAAPDPDQPGTPSLQVNAYRYEATVDGAVADLDGHTHFLAVGREDPQFPVTVHGLGEALPGGDNILSLSVASRSPQPAQLALTAQTLPSAGPPLPVTRTEVPAGQTVSLTVPYELAAAGDHQLKLSVAREPGGEPCFTATTELQVPALHATNFGYQLPGSTRELAVWWCSSGWKVSRRRPPPAEAAPALQIRAAANETESAQLVLRAANPRQLLTVSPSALQGPHGAVLPAECLSVLRVRYVHVTHPTDATGAVGDWPDPLPPLNGPLTLDPHVNQPLWVSVQVPRSTPPGTYRGRIRLAGPDGQLDVPVEVEVYGFALPDRMTCETAFGLNTGTIWQYHGLQSESQRREVLDKYLRLLAAHHLSPYDPAPLDPIQVRWTNLPAWQGGQRDREQHHAGAASWQVADESPTQNQVACHEPLAAIGPQGFTLRLWYRVAQPGHRFLVTLGHYDAQQQWLSGRNNDMVVEGDGTWQLFERTISQFPAEARSVQLRLWATLYREDGQPTGTVWFDDVSLVDRATGKEYVSDGTFEEQKQPAPRPVLDFANWDQALTRAIDTHHFNTFRLNLLGLGGGTFHDRYEPQLLGFTEQTPQYQQAMASYLGQLQAHLQQRGWLEEAFVYWFDEPDPKDYAFVMNGFAKLKRWAPGLRRMLTEQVEPELIGGPNLWCPVSSRYDHPSAEARRKAGATFWWYVCTGPKAPYCTLFIDHPATELRVWLWQTWQRDIHGILVWSSNYWTSSAAYPDPAHPQNPYLDPMGWVSGYSTPAGTRSAWGNGDGRFLYPPEAAADGRPAAPVLAGPVSSIRLAMLRDGIEDYEYCVRLRSLLHQHAARLTAAEQRQYTRLLDVPAELSRSLTQFTHDPTPLEEHRDRVARAIGRLERP